MKTVMEIARQTGVSVRTLHHYDAIGLLKPTATTDAGYRLYDQDAVERLYFIIIYRELGFSLKQIAAILDAPDFDRNTALEQQILLLEEKRQQLQNRIYLARAIQQSGVNNMDITKFDHRNPEEYASQAKALWGKTDAYREYEKKSAGRTKADNQALGDGLMALFARLGTLRQLDAASEPVQVWVAELQDYITAHYYTCTKPILKGLGEMYAGGGSMTENIDKAGGHGTGAFARDAIRIFCGE